MHDSEALVQALAGGVNVRVCLGLTYSKALLGSGYRLG